MAQIGQEIVNPRTGQRVRFIETADMSAGARLVLECVSPPSEEREPEHVHPYQTNRFAVHRGALHFRIAGRERVVAAGEAVSIPPGTPHHFWVEGSEPAEYQQEFEPALNTEAFFEALFGLAQAGRLSRSGMPPVLLLGVFGQTFWSTVRVTRPPRWVQWLTYAVLGPFGRLLGQRAAHRRYWAGVCARVARCPNDGERDPSGPPPGCWTGDDCAILLDWAKQPFFQWLVSGNSSVRKRARTCPLRSGCHRITDPRRGERQLNDLRFSSLTLTLREGVYLCERLLI